MNELLALMHDTVGRLGTIKSCATMIRKGTLSPEDTGKALAAIETRADELQKILDGFYSDVKTQPTNDELFEACKMAFDYCEKNGLETSVIGIALSIALKKQA